MRVVTGAARQAERLRRHREEMELAMREGLSLDQARRRRFQERHKLPAMAPAKPVFWWMDR